jgi:hypothetical protein
MLRERPLEESVEGWRVAIVVVHLAGCEVRR